MITRDPWADAHQVLAQARLDPAVAAVRRRLRFRRIVGITLGLVGILAAYALVQHLLDPDFDGLWSLPLHALRACFGVAGAGLVLVVVGSVRTSGAARPFVGPEAFLTRTDRAWLRTQIAENRSVPEERQAVVAGSARQMVVEGRYLPTYVGHVLLFVGVMVALPFPGLLLMFSALAVWSVAQVVRGAIWSRHAHRWLARHA